MPKRFARSALALLLCFTLTTYAQPGQALGGMGNWVTRGGNEQHQNTATQNLGTLTAFQAWAAEDLGLSAAQPLYVNGHIYYFTDRGLWDVDPTTGAATRLTDDWQAQWMNQVTYHGTTGLRPPTSSLTYAEAGSSHLLYFGTGANKVCAYNLDTSRLDCQPLAGVEPIVSTPLVLTHAGPDGQGPVDIVIMGDKAGNLWAYQGLGTRPVPFSKRKPITGAPWITASATRISDTDFLIAADGVGSYQGNGLVARFHVEATADGPVLTEVWSNYAAGGVADGLSLDGAWAYMVDTQGGLAKVAIGSGVIYRQTPLSPEFANSLAAIDEQRVYFSIRNAHSHSASWSDPGKLVAMNKSDWTVAWEAPMPADVTGRAYPANTTPLVWADQDVVLVGDTGGNIHGFDRNTGTERPFALESLTLDGGQTICRPDSHLSLLRVGEEPYTALHAYQQLNGSGTDPILADGETGPGLLVVGVNYTRPADHTSSGRLVAFRASGTYNIRWTADGVTLAPSEPLSVGQMTAINTGLTLDHGHARDVLVWFLYANDDGVPTRLLDQQQIRLEPGRVTPVAFTYTPAPEDPVGGQIVAVANAGDILWLPGSQADWFRTLLAQYLRETGNEALAGVLAQYPAQLRASWNSALATGGGLRATAQSLVDYWPTMTGSCAGAVVESELIPGQGLTPALQDNFLKIPVQVQDALDLEVVTVDAPATVTYDQNGTYTARWLIRNHGTHPVTVRRAADVSLSGGGMAWSVGNSNRSYAPGDTWEQTQVRITRGNRAYTVTVTVNSDRTVLEPDYANNTGSATTSVGPEPPIIPDTGGFAGGSDQMIVPPDCARNPDPFAPTPCTNYPHLKAPWHCRENRSDPDCTGY